MALKAEFQVHYYAAESLGFSIYFRGRWCAGTWPDEWHQNGTTRDLIFLEFFPILSVLWLWAEKWSNSVVRFGVTIKQLFISHSERVMNLVRPFILWALQFNIVVQAWHVPGLKNRIADALSHQQIKLFRELDPGAKEFLEVLGLDVFLEDTKGGGLLIELDKLDGGHET